MIQPGIYLDMSSDEYHGDRNSYSKTNIAHLTRSPLHMDYERKNPETKPAYDQGTAVHTQILEPDRWEKQIAVMPSEIKVRRGKAWEKFKAANEGKTIITAEQNAHADNMVDALFSHKQARDLLTSGHSETSIFWYEHFEKREGYFYHITKEAFEYADPEKTHSIILKCRPDKLPGDYCAVDLKTSSVITPDEFGRAAYNFKYHWSAWLTLRGLTSETGNLHEKYYFVVVENKPPFDVAVYKTPQTILDLAREEIARVLPALAECDHTGEFPGQPKEVQRLTFPGWAFTKSQNQIIHDPPAF